MENINETDRAHRKVKGNRTEAERPTNGRLNKRNKTMAQDLQAIGEIAVEGAQEKLRQFRASAGEYQEMGRDKLQEAEQTIEQFIRERPLKTVLIAVGVGWLLSRFWARH